MLAKEITKRHAVVVNGIVAVVSAAMAGFGTFAMSPKALTIDQVRDAIAIELRPIREEVAITRLEAARALSESQWVKGVIVDDVRPLKDSMSRLLAMVERLDERTKGMKPGG